MRPRKEATAGGRRRSRPSSSSSRQSSPIRSSPSVEEDTLSLFEDLKISQDYRNSSSEPRSFPHSVKVQCWEKAEKIRGRNPERWRRDPYGNIVFRKLVGCPGCLCHDYDHILPFSKGGKSTLENCQVLQATVNRSKGNRTELSRADLIQRSSYCRVSGRDMDLIELTAYGNVRHVQDNSGGCRIQ
ncbi:HNH endonuclease [Euphorbia peplus]|nr:HNH endonuclease [Euphorbia peplus]